MSESKRIILALSLSVAVIFVWQKYYTPEAPIVEPGTQVTNTELNTNAGSTGSIEPKSVAISQTNSGPIEPVVVAGETFSLSGNGAEYRIDSTLNLLNISADNAKFMYEDIIGPGPKPRILFKVNGFGEYKTINFQKILEQDGELTLENKEYGIVASYKVDENGLLGLNISSVDNFDLKFYINSTEESTDNREVRSFAILKKALVKFTVGDDEEKGSGSVKWFGVDFNYHLFAILFPKKTDVSYKAFEKGLFQVKTNGLFEGETNYDFDLKYAFTLKDYDTLSKLGENLDLSVDFGIWSILSLPMLKALKFFFSFLGNWGLAVIFLTICMRLLTFPLQYKSFKSMKRMQVIQPQLKVINEKHKNDAQKKQMETMALFKKEGVNPLGGCLPMLLQFPIFIAFYRMLGAAVELVGAPFYFWLSDLSVKDPYYILPVLVTLVMVLQQKITPNTTTDPMQKKMMMFMPLVFGFIMKDLPSGLNLYIFVSTTLGIVLQKVVFANIGSNDSKKLKTT